MAIAAVVIASTSAEPGLEDARLPRAREQIPAIVDRYAGLAVALGDRLAAINNQARMAESVADSARRLWQLSTAEIQTGLTDDRALYWGRLALRAVVYRDVDPQTRPALLEIVEQHSRGLTDTQFPDDAKPRLLITGFDPFHLDVEIAQSNPSGLAALSLTGVMLASGDGRAHVKGALIPVRFNDFDDGLIEGFLTEHYRRNQLSLVVTISMGRDAFDLERFPGRRRSAESPDNANVYTGANETNPLIPLLGGQPLQGPEFVEFSLPAAAMRDVEGDWAVRDNRNVQTLESGLLEASSLARVSKQIAVRGSGGGYLSNEISYRSILLRDKLGLAFPVGHIHTPSVLGYKHDEERRIVSQIRQMLERAIAAIQQPGT